MGPSPLSCVWAVSEPVIKHLPGDQAEVRQYDQVEEEDPDNSLSDDLVMRGGGGGGEVGVVGSEAGLGQRGVGGVCSSTSPTHSSQSVQSQLNSDPHFVPGSQELL